MKRLKKLHWHKAISVYVSDCEIAFASSDSEGVGYPLNTDNIDDISIFLSEYEGIFVFYNAIRSIMKIHDIFGIEPEVFEGCDDAQILVYLEKNSAYDSNFSLRAAANDFIKGYRNNPLDPMNDIVRSAKAIWHVVDNYLDKCDKELIDDFYNDVVKNSVIPIINTSIEGGRVDNEKLEANLEKNNTELLMLMDFLGTHKMIKKYEEECLPKGNTFNPYSVKDVKHLLVEFLGYETDNLLAILWEGDYDEIVMLLISIRELMRQINLMGRMGMVDDKKTIYSLIGEQPIARFDPYDGFVYIPEGFRLARIQNDNVQMVNDDRSLINEAHKKGFIRGAFGIKIRTPKAKKAFIRTSSIPRSVLDECSSAAMKLIETSIFYSYKLLAELMEKANGNLIPLNIDINGIDVLIKINSDMDGTLNEGNV